MVSGSNNSRNKKGGKQKMVLAKDFKQLAIAIIVIVIFIGNSIFMLIKGYQEQHPKPVATSAQTNPGDEGLGQNIPPQGGNPQNAQDTNNIYSETVQAPNGQPTQNPSGQPLTASGGNIAPAGGENVEILTAANKTRTNEKMVSIAVDNTVRANPFLPANESFSSASPYYLTPPPETLPTNSEAGRVMTTTISGILYDKYSPSAIINIEGADYLVKKGDVINNYRVLSIAKNQVIVQLGKNIYQAGVGELLTQTNMNYNTIANLNKKFGGNDISINVRKKGY